MASKPGKGEYAESFAGYVALVPEEDILPVLEAQQDQLRRIVASIPADRETFRYAPDKWSVREVFGHLIDSDRVFGHRAFCVSRGEKANLPSFDEVQYVAASGYHQRPLRELFAELVDARAVNLHLYRNLKGADWTKQGTANGNPITVRALAYITVGHIRHHLNLLNERYGVSIDR